MPFFVHEINAGGSPVIFEKNKLSDISIVKNYQMKFECTSACHVTTIPLCHLLGKYIEKIISFASLNIIVSMDIY